MRRRTIFLLFLFTVTARAQDFPARTAHEAQQRLRPQPAAVSAAPPALLHTAPMRERERTHVVFGYHPYWIADSVTRHYDFSLLSHLAYFSAEVDAATGEMKTVRGWPAIPVLDRAAAAGVQVQLAVTNFGAADNRSLLSSQAARDTCVARIVALLRQRDADGVSIDFEAVPGDQRGNLTAFFAALDAALAHALPEAEISAAVPAVDWNDAWDFEALRAHIDLFFLMGYDYFWSGSSTAGPVAPIHGATYNAQRSLDAYLQKGVPPERLLLGVPYYGYDWPVVSGAEGAATTGRAVARTYSFVQDMAGLQQRQWSTTYANPWFAYETANWRQVWFDDTESLGQKYDLVLDRGIAGVGIWALGYDGSASALRELLREKFTRVTSVRAPSDVPETLMLQAFPQPLRSGEMLTLRSAGERRDRVHLRLTDMLGRIRWEGSMDETQRSLQLLLPPLPPGMYSLGMRSGLRRAARPLLIVR